ncbi:MAG: hypothetical protein DBX91_06500 [Subdoligranulum variabile]|nr:MAG: hypothetical protein DBX91_06500 [Subdoligranulum variabile]
MKPFPLKQLRSHLRNATVAFLVVLILSLSGCDSTPYFNMSVSQEDIEETALRLISLQYDLSQFDIMADSYFIESEEITVDGEKMWEVDVIVSLFSDQDPPDKIQCKVELTYGLDNGEWVIVKSSISPS